MDILGILLQAPGGGNTTLIMMGGMVLVFYFFMIRPQAKKAKKQKTFISDLQKGDKIVTIAGIHGKINRVNDDGSTLEVETSPGSYIKIERSAVSMEWSENINKPLSVEPTK